MKNRKILIVEDEAPIAMDIEMRLKAMDFDVLRIAHNPASALAQLESERPDLILMDINLKNGDEGIGLAEEVMKNWQIPVIFLTGHSDAQTFSKALEINPYGYVSKPFKDADLRNTIDLAWHNYENAMLVPVRNDTKSDSIFVKDGSGLVQLKFKDIQWIRAYDNYCKVYLNDQEYVISLLLKEFDQKLPDGFVRVHRSFIVSTSQITKLTSDTILIGENEIPIGKAYRESLLKLLNI